MADRERVLIVAEGCPGCEEARRAAGDDVRVLDVTRSEEAARIVRSLGIYRVPALVEIDRDSGRACVTEGDRIRCADLDWIAHR